MTPLINASDSYRRSTWLRAARYAWLLVVIATLTWLLATRGDEMINRTETYSPRLLASCLACVLLGKWLVLLQMRLSLIAVKGRFAVSDILYVYSMSDVSKYLPGGVWGILGRIGLYRARGLTNRQAAVALLLESTWLIAGAFVVGAALAIDAIHDLAFANLAWPESAQYVRVVAMAGALVILLAINLGSSRVLSSRLSVGQSLGLVALQVGTWVLLGLGFGLLVPGTGPVDLLFTASGGFSMAFGTGFLVVFAPAGIGVREVASSALLYRDLSVEVLLAMNVVNRLIWIVADIVFALVAWSLAAGRKWRRP